jgi:hypothetical protein
VAGRRCWTFSQSISHQPSKAKKHGIFIGSDSVNVFGPLFRGNYWLVVGSLLVHVVIGLARQEDTQEPETSVRTDFVEIDRIGDWIC